MKRPPSRAHFEDLADDKVANASAASGSMIDVNRATLGSVVVPRAGELDEEAVRALPPAMQFEVLEEIKLGERNRRRDALVRREHTADSFSHQQLHNYIQVAKVAGRVNELREQLNNTAQQSRRIASDQTREYVLLDRRAGATPSPAAAGGASDAPWDGDSDEGEGEGEAAAAAAVAGQGDEETELLARWRCRWKTPRRAAARVRRVPAAPAAAAAAPPRARPRPTATRGPARRSGGTVAAATLAASRAGRRSRARAARCAAVKALEEAAAPPPRRQAARARARRRGRPVCTHDGAGEAAGDVVHAGRARRRRRDDDLFSTSF